MDHQFTDSLQTNKKEFLQLTQDVLQNNLLSIGEIHGIKENAYLYYSLFSLFEFNTLALEYPISIKDPIINYLQTGVFPIHRLTENISDGNVNKTYILMMKHLYDEGLLKKIIFFDPEKKDYLHWNDRDKALAETFLSQHSKEDRTLIVTANLHSKTSPFELKTQEKAESGQLFPFGYHLLQTLGNYPVCKLFYHSGTYYNFQIKTLPTSFMPAHMLRKRKSVEMRYEIHLNKVNPVEAF